jgi:transketolase
LRTAFVRSLVDAAERDERIVLLTGDLGFMALEPFRDRFPERFYNMGVAEQNMVGVATGLAEAGFIPFCYSIVPFAVLRPYEFIRNGPVAHHLRVRIVGVGGGLEYGRNGSTHYGIEDVGAMRLLPGMAVIAPADPAQTVSAVEALADWPGPAYLRIGKNDRQFVRGLQGRFEFAKAQTLREGCDVVLLVLGSVAASVVSAADELRAYGIEPTVTIVACISPPPIEDISRLVSTHRVAVTVEAHVRNGGLGSLVAEVIAESGAQCRLVRLGVDQPSSSRGGGEEFLHELHGLSARAIEARVRQMLRSGETA